MKQLWVVFVLVCFSAAGICHAEDAKCAAPAAGEKIIQVDRNGDGTMDGEDVYNSEGKLIRKGYDSDGDGVMESYQSYDPNTGMPDVVPSDKNMELM